MQVVKREKGKYLQLDFPGDQIAAPLEIMEAVALGSGERVNKLLIDGRCLPAVFYDLSSGFAGEMCRKLMNYRIQTAIVLPPGLKPSDRFGEWMGECNRGKEICFTANSLQGERWLLSAGKEFTRRNSGQAGG